MRTSITPFGKKWEYLHSIWMIWLAGPFGFTMFVSFFYIGARAKKVKWIVAGVIYFIIVAQYFVVSDFYEIDETPFTVSMLVLLLFWAISVIHAIMARKEYLIIRVEQINANRAYWNLPPIEHEQTITKQAADISNIKKDISTNENGSQTEEEQKPRVVNVNQATQEELTALPAMNNVLASQIIDSREEEGDFDSFSHFIARMNMKPHILAKAKPYMKFTDENHVDHEKQQRDDRKESASHLSGRIVDY